MHYSNSVSRGISRIIRLVSDKSRCVNIGKGYLISMNNTPEPECIITHSGHIHLRRTDDKLILGSICGPALFGFNDFIELTGNVFLETVTPVCIETVPVSTFYGKIAEKNLWQPLLDVSKSVSAELFRQVNLSTVRDSNLIITNHLSNLINEPVFIRDTTTACDYIKQRTNLSRSGIMKHLAILRSSGRIEMENGVLKKMNRIAKRT